MVLLDHRYCLKCGIVTPHGNGKCGSCTIRQYDESLRVWRTLDVEARLEDLRQRVESLEKGQ